MPGPRPRYPNTVIRSLAFVAALASLALWNAPAGADQTAIPAFRSAAPQAQERSRDGGIVAGRILGVDYVRGIMSLHAARGNVDVYVLPSTNILGKSGYNTIADLKKGSSVEIFTSVVGTRTNAQIIKLK